VSGCDGANRPFGRVVVDLDAPVRDIAQQRGPAPERKADCGSDVGLSAGFTPEGLPAGLQIVGRNHADFSALQTLVAQAQTQHHAATLANVAPILPIQQGAATQSWD
jgi:hypothetical protein